MWGEGASGRDGTAFNPLPEPRPCSAPLLANGRQAPHSPGLRWVARVPVGQWSVTPIPSWPTLASALVVFTANPFQKGVILTLFPTRTS